MRAFGAGDPHHELVGWWWRSASGGRRRHCRTWRTATALAPRELRPPSALAIPPAGRCFDTSGGKCASRCVSPSSPPRDHRVVLRACIFTSCRGEKGPRIFARGPGLSVYRSWPPPGGDHAAHSLRSCAIFLARASFSEKHLDATPGRSGPLPVRAGGRIGFSPKRVLSVALVAVVVALPSFRSLGPGSFCRVPRERPW